MRYLLKLLRGTGWVGEAELRPPELGDFWARPENRQAVREICERVLRTLNPAELSIVASFIEPLIDSSAEGEIQPVDFGGYAGDFGPLDPLVVTVVPAVMKVVEGLAAAAPDGEVFGSVDGQQAELALAGADRDVERVVRLVGSRAARERLAELTRTVRSAVIERLDQEVRHATSGDEPPSGGPPPGKRPSNESGELRYTDISCPREVWLETPRFTVSVCLTVSDPGPVSAGDRVLRTDTGRPVTVHLHAPGFELLSEESQELELEPGKDSEVGIFHLRPTISGDRQLLFSFLQSGQPLGTVSVAVKVVENPVPEGRRANDRHALHLAGEQKAPARVLIVLWDPEDSVLKLSLVERGGVSLRQFPSFRLPADPADWADRLFGDLTFLSDHSDPVSQRRVLQPDDVDRRLKILGQDLWRRLPKELRSLYREQRGRWHDRSLLIHSNEPYLPWELIWPYGRGWEDEEPWCLSMRLSRWLVQDTAGGGNPGPPGQLPLDALACVTPPDSGLAAARQEQTFLRDLIADEGLRDVSPVPTWPAVQDRLAKGGYDWVHVAAHGNFYADSGRLQSVLWLEGDQALMPEHIVGPEVELHLQTERPAFFFNACDAGRLGWNWNGLEGWADQLITLGAGMFLAPLWAAEDTAALTLARNFYRGLLAGQTVAEALRQARRAARSPGNPTWCAYSLYAHPNAKLRLRQTA